MESADKDMEALLAEAKELAVMEAISDPAQRQRAQELQGELRQIGSQLYDQPVKREQGIRILDLAYTLGRLLAFPKACGQRFETLDAGNFETPISDLRLSPFQIRNHIAARLITTLDGEEIVRTHGIHVGLEVANPEDSRLGTRRRFVINRDLEHDEPRRRAGLRKRGIELQRYMLDEAKNRGFYRDGFGFLQVVEQESNNTKRFGNGARRVFALNLGDSGLGIIENPQPGDIGVQIQRLASDIFNRISQMDTGPHWRHQNRGRSSRR